MLSNLKCSPWTIKTTLLILCPYIITSLYLGQQSVLGLGLINTIGFAYPVSILSRIKSAKKQQDFLIGLYSILGFIAVLVMFQVILYTAWNFNIIYSFLLAFDIVIFSIALTFESKS